MDLKATKIEALSVDAIRALSMDAVQKANSGHPGTPMALAPVAYTIFTKFLRHNPENPLWPDHDRFVLSAGHASMLLYSMLYLTGYGLTLEELEAGRAANRQALARALSAVLPSSPGMGADPASHPADPGFPGAALGLGCGHDRPDRHAGRRQGREARA